MTILPPNIRIFPFLGGISLADKPVDRNTCFYSHVAERFFVERVYLLGYSQKTSKEFEHFGLQNSKNIRRENLLVQRTFSAKLLKSNFESKDGTRSMKY